MKPNECKKVEAFIQKYGFATLQELMEKSELNQVQSSVKEELSPSQKLIKVYESFADRCAPWSENCMVGDIVYQTGAITDQIQKDLRAIGVVGWKNGGKNPPVGQRGLMISLLEENKPWSSVQEFIGAVDRSDGFANTKALLRLSVEKDWRFPAAEWCAAYAEEGIMAGEGFLAARAQWAKIFTNINVINTSLEKIGIEELCGWYASSSECDDTTVWNVHAGGGDMYEANKAYTNQHVRCVVAF